MDLSVEFPVLHSQDFFNHAAVAPIPHRSAEALRAWAGQAENSVATDWIKWSTTVGKTRESAARLIHAPPDSVGLIHNTTHGLLVVAASMRWRPGDNVVLPEGEFPANIYPWKNLESRGVALRFVPGRGARFRIEDFLERIDRRTRLVTLSLVQSATGYRMPVERLAEICRPRGILLCVDGIQGIGAFPVDVDSLGCDFMVANGHKWMMSPEGLGLLYVRPDAMDHLDVSMVGWRGRSKPWDYDDLDQPVASGARRFEDGSLGMALAAAFERSLSLLHEVGEREIWRSNEALGDHLCERAMERGFEVVSPRGPGEKSAIVSLRVPQGFDPAEVARTLRARRIHVAGRRGMIRVAPHFYNRPEQLDRLLSSLEEILAA